MPKVLEIFGDPDQHRKSSYRQIYRVIWLDYESEKYSLLNSPPKWPKQHQLDRWIPGFFSEARSHLLPDDKDPQSQGNSAWLCDWQFANLIDVPWTCRRGHQSQYQSDRLGFSLTWTNGEMFSLKESQIKLIRRVFLLQGRTERDSASFSEVLSSSGFALRFVEQVPRRSAVFSCLIDLNQELVPLGRTEICWFNSLQRYWDVLKTWWIVLD